MVQGGAEYQVQEAMNHAVINWSKTFLHDTNAGLHGIGQAASMGVQGDLMRTLRYIGYTSATRPRYEVRATAEAP